MLHLVFHPDGVNRILPSLRPNDQVVQFSKEQIFLLDTRKYLERLGQQTSSFGSGHRYQGSTELMPQDGTTITKQELAQIIDSATCIKTTS